jgi:SAM-dependent methyltransferase
MKLNMGCGTRKLSGDWVNVDKIKHENVDIVHDLNVFPYPFDGDSVKDIYMYHVLEHLKEPYDVVVECHRILEPSGTLEITVPHKNHLSAYDIAHPRLFTERSLSHLNHTGVSSLQCEPLFKEIVCDVKRVIPTPWGYLNGFNLYKNAIGIGIRSEIRWVLEKNLYTTVRGQD